MSAGPLEVVVATGGRFHMPWVARALAAQSVRVHAFSGRCHRSDLAGCASIRTPMAVNVARAVAVRASPSNTAVVNHVSDASMGRQIRRFTRTHQHVPVVHLWSAYAAETFQWLTRRDVATLKVLESGSFHVLSDFELLGPEAPATLKRPAWRERLLAEYEMADAIIVPSQAAADSFSQHGLGEKVRVIRYGVDPSYSVSPGQVPRHRDVLFVGNLTSQKGADLLQGLAAGLSDAGRSLTVIGRDPGTGVAQRLRNCRNVTVMAPVPAPRLRSYFAESRLLVLPSRQEGFGMVALEAMAAGCVPLVSDAAGVSEVVSDFDPTLVLPSPGPVSTETDPAPSVDEYLPRALSLLEDVDDLDRMHGDAHAFARDQSWSSFATNCRHIYLNET
ncbi:MAG: hypothetical protein QOE58_2273 [Actinomycetota bacterium]|nr:hypothetical protein [Actinomycetota bacterium]